MNRKILSYLGFAEKSANAISGTNTCESELKKRKVYLVLISEDASDNTKINFKEIADSKKIPWRICGNSEEISKAIGKTGRNVIAVKEKNLAEAIISEIDLLDRY